MFIIVNQRYKYSAIIYCESQFVMYKNMADNL